MTILPLTFVGITTLVAGYLNIKNIYLPQTQLPDTLVPGIINLVLTVAIVLCLFVLLVNAIPKWIGTIKNGTRS